MRSLLELVAPESVDDDVDVFKVSLVHAFLLPCVAAVVVVVDVVAVAVAGGGGHGVGVCGGS